MSDATAACPFCGSTDLETVAAWGGQLITSQSRCRGCNTYFEALREIFDPEHLPAPARTTPAASLTDVRGGAG